MSDDSILYLEDDVREAARQLEDTDNPLAPIAKALLHADEGSTYSIRSNTSAPSAPSKV